MIHQAREFAIKVHSGTNHMYDDYLPYEYHLRHVMRVAGKFIGCLSDSGKPIEQSFIEIIGSACWLHDTIEDCRVTYSQIWYLITKAVDGGINCPEATQVAEIVRAVTNDQRGRNRAEKMTDECYQDILTVPGALFVKLCDRIANVEYSTMTDSSKLDMYKKEYSFFCEKLRQSNNNLEPMWEHLDKLLK